MRPSGAQHLGIHNGTKHSIWKTHTEPISKYCLVKKSKNFKENSSNIIGWCPYAHGSCLMRWKAKNTRNSCQGTAQSGEGISMLCSLPPWSRHHPDHKVTQEQGEQTAKEEELRKSHYQCMAMCIKYTVTVGSEKYWRTTSCWVLGATVDQAVNGNMVNNPFLLRWRVGRSEGSIGNMVCTWAWLEICRFFHGCQSLLLFLALL